MKKSLDPKDVKEVPDNSPMSTVERDLWRKVNELVAVVNKLRRQLK